MKKIPLPIEAAEPIAVASEAIRDANSVPVEIVVFP